MTTHVPEFRNLVELFERSIKLFHTRPLFGVKKQGQWNYLTYAEFGELVEHFRGGLASLGIKRGDCVAIVSNNRVEWAVAAYACYGLGASLVPMYEAQLAKEWAFIVNDCQAVALIAATDVIYEKTLQIQAEAPSLKFVIGLSRPDNDPMSYAALLRAGAAAPVPSIHPEEKDTACLIYTSGTTGNPKGVILSHGNIASNVTAIHHMIPFADSDRSLSFLPWAHSFGHTCELHGLFSMGASMAIAEGVDKIVPNLSEVSPTMLVAVPRIFNRIYDGVNKQMQGKPALIQKLFHGGMSAARKRRNGESLGLLEEVTLFVADKLVFGKIRGKFGGNLKYAISGGAALSKEVAEFIDSLGITVFEGYGLTETSPIATANFPGAHRLGSVGKAAPDVRVILDKSVGSTGEDGEILVYGPNVMQGYHNRPQENAEAFTADGGFRTGDLGRFDADGFLFITGRIKEQYKLENGKYVAPAPLEEQLKLSPFIVNAMVYGDNRLFNVAIIVPERAELEPWCRAQGFTEDYEALLLRSEVIAQMQDQVEQYSKGYKSFEKVKRIALVAEDFTTENGLLTPSLKLKRRVALQRYGEVLNGLYS
jgi:long-chain acyl-CoA synthetase